MKYDAGDFTHHTPPRIIGSETEFTAGTKDDVDFANLFTNIDSSTILTSSSPGVHDSIWLRNGALIYQDIGDVHEYATPECMSAIELLRYEKAGEEIIQAAASRALPSPLDRVYKRSGYTNVYSSSGTLLLGTMSTGHHENYYFPRTDLLAPGSRSKQALESYLSTRAIWSGTGIVWEHGYDISQKAQSVSFKGLSGIDEGKKTGYIMHDDESRLEIRIGEGNMSDWAVVQKFAMTSLVLRLIEHGRFPSHLALQKDPTKVMRAVSRYPAAALLGLEHISPANHQKMIAEHQPDIPAEEIHAAEEIIRTCKEIDNYLLLSGDLADISDRIDWAAKYHRMIEKGFTEFDITSENLEAVMHDISWENISARGISRLWYKRKNPIPLLKPTDIRHAHHTPPETRAKLRTQIIKKNMKQGDIDQFNYVTWNLIYGNKSSFRLSDPYENRFTEPQ
jgi:hypothetical protein